MIKAMVYLNVQYNKALVYIDRIQRLQASMSTVSDQEQLASSALHSSVITWMFSEVTTESYLWQYQPKFPHILNSQISCICEELGVLCESASTMRKFLTETQHKFRTTHFHFTFYKRIFIDDIINWWGKDFRYIHCSALTNSCTLMAPLWRRITGSIASGR
jgi:hypothetical protein